QALSNLNIGEPFKMREMERRLLYLNRTPGLEVSSTLKPGEETGSTEMQLEVKEEKRIMPSVTVNNYGSKSTGEIRIIPAVDLPNLTGRGDLLGAYGMLVPEYNDRYFGLLSYSLPIIMQGMRLNPYVSGGNYCVGG